MINIGHAVAESEFYARTLRVLADPRGPAFESRPPPEIPEPSKPAPEALST
jgi:hypothetical protein